MKKLSRGMIFKPKNKKKKGKPRWIKEYLRGS
jgi:hypothetical protein